MNIQQFLNGLDKLFEKGAIEQVEPYFHKALAWAEHDHDMSAKITILNEAMGFYRETSQYEKAKACIREVLEIMEQVGLADSIPYATTLLNAANALRAAGELEEAMKDYNQVFTIYEGQVPQVDFRYAELYNNVALLYQEMEQYDMATRCLEQALVIVRQMPGKEFQTAITLANLGSSELQEKRQEQAEEHLKEAITLFQSMNITDTHMAAALAAMGEACYLKKQFEAAEDYYSQALQMIESYVGKTDAYQRVADNLQQVKQAREQAEKDGTVTKDRKQAVRESGLTQGERFYRERGADMIHDKFPAYENRIAVGIVGEGSERFGFDDAISEDHDFGVGFCMWLTNEDYEQIGEALQTEYEAITGNENKNWTIHAQGRFGVGTIHEFYQGLTGRQEAPKTKEEWLQLSEERIAAATNGVVFRDDLGEFSRIREQYLEYYPESVRLLKMAQYVALFGQYGQYNYERMAKRQDWVAAGLMRERAMEAALHMVYLLNRRYCPHDKWLWHGLKEVKLCKNVSEVCVQLVQTGIKEVEQNRALLEQIAGELLQEMLNQGLVYPHRRGDILFMEPYGSELAARSKWEDSTVEELAEQIAQIEFQAFDKVKNEGGRAGCQDDWYTFRIMRVSQYRTWTKDMLIQYLKDFYGTLADGWNMITEKYGRMMASTAPEKYAELEPQLPKVTEEKRKIVEEIVRIQVAWMEEFSRNYPKLAGNARVIHTGEDTAWDTSYETYLRGELLTYSDTMLVMYGRLIAQYAGEHKNLATAIMNQTVLLYGYRNLEEAEQAMSSN